MLEDRVYEYDAAYQALELELADSQQAYLDIQSKLKCDLSDWIALPRKS
jgi:hypothetical protein